MYGIVSDKDGMVTTFVFPHYDKIYRISTYSPGRRPVDPGTSLLGIVFTQTINECYLSRN